MQHYQWEKLAHNLISVYERRNVCSRSIQNGFLPLGPGKWHTVASPLRPLNKLNYATFKHCHRWTRHELSFSFTFSKMIFHRGVITYSSSWICNHLSFSSGAFLISVCLFVCLFFCTYVCFCLFVITSVSPLTPFSSPAPPQVWPPCLASLWFPSP